MERREMEAIMKHPPIPPLPKDHDWLNVGETIEKGDMSWVDYSTRPKGKPSFKWLETTLLGFIVSAPNMFARRVF